MVDKDSVFDAHPAIVGAMRALILILLLSCNKSKPVEIELLPAADVIYKLAEELGFESWNFGLSVVDGEEGRDQIELYVEYRARGKVVRTTNYGTDALAAFRNGNQLQNFHVLMPAALDVDAMHTQLLKAGAVVAERTVRLTRYEQHGRYTLPVRGCWLVSSGHDFGVEHRRWYNRAHFGWDFVKVDGDGNPKGDGDGLDTYYAFGAGVFAPADGRIVMAEDRHPDNPPGEVRAKDQANYVLIDHGNGELVKLAHFKRGSLHVKPGDNVTMGQVIAQVGNSGMSDAPHLHVHFQEMATDSTGMILDEKPLPIRFSGYTVTSNKGVRQPVEAGRPRRGEFVCSGSEIDVHDEIIR